MVTTYVAYIYSEDKIDRMDGRLASIEQLLQRLTKQPSAPATHVTDSPASSSHAINDGKRALTYNVGTGPNVDVAAAKELFEKTVGSSPKLQQSVAEALQALQGIVGRLDVDSEMNHIAAPPQKLVDVAPPPWSEVASILQRASGMSMILLRFSIIADPKA